MHAPRRHRSRATAERRILIVHDQQPHRFSFRAIVSRWGPWRHPSVFRRIANRPLMDRWLLDSTEAAATSMLDPRSCEPGAEDPPDHRIHLAGRHSPQPGMVIAVP